MSEVIVAKAGGTSNADAAAVEQSLGWAERSEIFVVSAPGKLGGEGMINGKVTDMLLGAHESYRQLGEVSEDHASAITERYEAIVEGLGESALGGRWIDRIPTRIRAAAEQGKDAASMLGERLQAEIYESLGFTLLDPGRAPHALGNDPAAWRGWLAFAPRGDRYVLPGNTTQVDDRLVTFSRGGSDTSGGLAAYGRGAALHLNLTDHGALSANPAYFEGEEQRLKVVPHLLYEEGRELGRNGTGLLHPAAMVPLMRGHIPTEIRSTSIEDDRVTRLDNDHRRASKREGDVIATSLMEDVTMHRVHEPGMAEAVGRLAAFETALAEEGIAIIDAQGDGVDGQKYFIASDVSDRAHRILKDLARLGGGGAETTSNLNLLTLVGYRLETTLIDNVLRLVESSGIDIHVWQSQAHDISTGRHSLRVSAEPYEARKLLDSVHTSFIER